MSLKAYAAHEQATAGALMLLKMIIGALICGLALGLVVFFLGLGRIDSGFSDQGFPPGAIRSYLLNRPLTTAIPLPLSMDTPADFSDFMPAPRIGRREYNRLLEARFASVHSLKRLEAAVVDFRRLLWLSLTVLLLTGSGYLFFFARRSRSIKIESHIKGARLLDKARFLSLLGREMEDPLGIGIGDIPFPRRREPMHTLVYGASGSGKSTLMNQLLDAVRKRQQAHGLPEKTIVYDVKGEYVAKHFSPDRGDGIFFPFDARSSAWSLFNELLSPSDPTRIDPAMVDVVSTLLCSPTSKPDGKNDYFYGAAAEVLRAMLLTLDARGTRSNRDIAEMLGRSRSELSGLFRELLPACDWSVIEHLAAPEQAAGVLGILKNQLRFLRYIQDQDGAFSLRQFIESKDSRTLFLMNLPRLAEVFRPLMTFAVDLMIRHTLSLPDSPDRRIQFFIDELGSLGRLDSLLRFLTLSRSKGGCLYAANQEEGTIRELYGDKLTESFNNNFASLLVFRQNDEKSALSMSKQLGEHEVIKRTESHSFSPSSQGDRLSVGDQQKRETLVTYSELQHLPDLAFFYKLSGIGTARFMTPARFLPPRNPHHLERSDPPPLHTG
jgi:GTPase SAR1 family protein